MKRFSINHCKHWFQDRLTQVNTLKSRERVILCFALVIVIYAVWNNFMYQPVKRDIKTTTTSIQQVTQQISTIDQEIRNIVEELSEREGEGAEDLSTRAQLVQRAQILDARLGIVTSDLVSPEQMISALHAMLERQQGLQLLSLDTSPAAELSADIPKENNGNGKEITHMVIPGIYKHEITIVLLGDYFNVLQYLEALEGLGWRLFWDSFDYQVIDYPTAQIRIKLHTLSSEKGFIGGG